MRAFAAALAAAALLAAGCDAAPRHSDTFVPVAENDAEMNAAIASAKETLPVFWKVFDARPADVSYYSVKLRMPTPGGGEEHIWIENVTRQGDRVSGTLANDPEYLKDVRYGSPVSANVSDISDWAYTRAGKHYGFYTARVLIKREPPPADDDFYKNLAPEPLEPGQP